MGAMTAQQWRDLVKALRSGDYNQGQCALREKAVGGDAYCCLGVACEVAGVPWMDPEDVDPRRYRVDRGSRPDGFESYFSTAYAPFALIEWDVQEQLATMNDGGYSFNDIADQIEHWFEMGMLP